MARLRDGRGRIGRSILGNFMRPGYGDHVGCRRRAGGRSTRISDRGACVPTIRTRRHGAWQICFRSLISRSRHHRCFRVAVGLTTNAWVRHRVGRRATYVGRGLRREFRCDATAGSRRTCLRSQRLRADWFVGKLHAGRTGPFVIGTLGWLLRCLIERRIDAIRDSGQDGQHHECFERIHGRPP